MSTFFDLLLKNFLLLQLLLETDLAGTKRGWLESLLLVGLIWLHLVLIINLNFFYVRLNGRLHNHTLVVHLVS
jgi:hypothetical protein